jgi:cbb3-type cytochrome oxidase subunit 3
MMSDPVMMTALIVMGIVSCAFLVVQYNKTKRIIEADANYEKREDGKTEKGHVRNVWDYSFFPGFSRVLFRADWKILLAILLLIFLAVLYGIFREKEILDLLKVNVGAVIGTLVGGRTDESELGKR